MCDLEPDSKLKHINGFMCHRIKGIGIDRLFTETFFFSPKSLLPSFSDTECERLVVTHCFHLGPCVCTHVSD